MQTVLNALDFPTLLPFRPATVTVIPVPRPLAAEKGAPDKPVDQGSTVMVPEIDALPPTALTVTLCRRAGTVLAANLAVIWPA